MGILSLAMPSIVACRVGTHDDAVCTWCGQWRVFLSDSASSTIVAHSHVASHTYCVEMADGDGDVIAIGYYGRRCLITAKLPRAPLTVN